MAFTTHQSGSMETVQEKPNRSGGAPSPAKCQAQFELGLTLSLFAWPSLTLAVTSLWGGPESSAKREWFAQTLVDLLQEEENTDADAEWIETFLLQVMMDEFEVSVEDDSAWEVAEQIVRLRGACAKGEFAEVESMRERWEARGGRDVMPGFKETEREEGADDTDESAEESDGDVEMGDAPPVGKTKEKLEPEVDEDGFTKVTKKKR